MMVCNTFRFQFILNSYYAKELLAAMELYHLYVEKYPYNPKQEYLYLALWYVASNKKLSVKRLLKGVDKRSMSLFYKEVERIERLEKKTFKKKEYGFSDREIETGVSEGFL